MISGDDPGTVAALAARAGISGEEPVHGSDLAGLPDADLDRAVAGAAVFGRIAREQKERIVASLHRQDRYVAMVGDGVNDARALKAAHAPSPAGAGGRTGPGPRPA